MFTEPEVIFCGYVIKGNGLKPVADKVDTIFNALEPKGVSQLRAFLGMLHNYHRFLPDLSSRYSTNDYGKEKSGGEVQNRERIASMGGIVGAL